MSSEWKGDCVERHSTNRGGSVSHWKFAWLGALGGGAIALGALYGAHLHPLTNTLEQSAHAQTIDANRQQASHAFAQAYDALAAGRAGTAISVLEGVDERLPHLADQVLMVRAIAYEQANSPVSAGEAWQQLLNEHPDSTLVPRALAGMGRTEELRSRFPEHPITADYLRDAVNRQPQNYDLLAHLARIDPGSEGLTVHLNRWVEARGDSFTPDDWQIVADGYWGQREYGRASRAYQPTRANPQTLYRLGRSHQISREPSPAIAAYSKLITEFPNAEEVGEARLRWAELVDTNTAISLLRQEADRNSDSSPQALRRLARIYYQIGNGPATEAARQELWQRYPHTEPAGDLAWAVAAERAEAGNFVGAAALAQQIANGQSSTDWGAQLQFWAGKWHARAGNNAAAIQAYQQVLMNAQSSYYAWRAASLLGIPTGDFSSGRLAVTLTYEPAVLSLPAVSDEVQELHTLGLADAAWERWRWEAAGQEDTTRSIFAGGVLRNRASAYLDRLNGINQVASLLELAKEGDPVAQQLQQRDDFWQTVYPLHHYEILTAEAATFNLNPLVMAGLIRQESRFEPEIVSRSGALGLSQVMPATGAWIAGHMGRSQYNLRTPADNIEFGAWYLDYTHRTYQNNSMLAIASYNAGPGNVARWQQQYSLADPDIFVEQIPFPETRHYVKAVLGNYWNYLQIYAPDTNNLSARLAAFQQGQS